VGAALVVVVRSVWGDGGTNFILRIKEQETCLTLQEHYNDKITTNICENMT
jgi:hypothetical protein